MKVVVLFAVLIGVVATPVKADQLQWHFRNLSSHNLQLDFKSESGNRWWPGSDRAWTLNDRAEHDYTLNCIRGETICYGGWILGDDRTYWGEGSKHNHSCSKCCAVCGAGDAPGVNLTDGETVD
jgi:hypothetical protein